MDGFLISALVSGLISVSTAVIILRLQEWRNKKRLFRALYNEVEDNLSIAKAILPHVESISSLGKRYVVTGSVDKTVFDLQYFRTYCHQDFRRSGYLLSLHEKARQLLEEAYELIFSHNLQTRMFLHEPIPRSKGYSERVKILIDKLRQLKKELKPYI